jgi:hypothetical protein
MIARDFSQNWHVLGGILGGGAEKDNSCWLMTSQTQLVMAYATGCEISWMCEFLDEIGFLRFYFVDKITQSSKSR